MTDQKYAVFVPRDSFSTVASKETAYARVSLAGPPSWHADPQPAAHQRPTETPMYARRATFGASGTAQPDWRE